MLHNDDNLSHKNLNRGRDNNWSINAELCSCWKSSVLFFHSSVFNFVFINFLWLWKSNPCKNGLSHFWPALAVDNIKFCTEVKMVLCTEGFLHRSYLGVVGTVRLLVMVRLYHLSALVGLRLQAFIMISMMEWRVWTIKPGPDTQHHNTLAEITK